MASALTTEELNLIVKNNEACVTGDAAFQLYVSKKELEKRAKTGEAPVEVTELTKRMMQLAGLK